MTGSLVFILGLALGSFLNVVIVRWPHRDKSILWGRSKCVHCHHQLNWLDNFPILSFLYLKGRCRYCGGRISWQYPLIELTSGLGFFLIYLDPGSPTLKIWLTGIFFLWLFIFAYDLKYLIIPDALVGLSLVWILIGLAIFKLPIVSNFLTGLGIFGFFLGLYLLSQGHWIGGGDVKLGFLMGLWLGWPLGILAVLLAYILGALISLALLALKKVTLKSRVPFGPFLILGSWLAYFYGYPMMNWYTGLFFK